MYNISSVKLKFVSLFCAIVFVFLNATPSFSQDAEQEEQERMPVDVKKKFHAGLLIGSYFANKYSAELYDGYGQDFEGNKKTFDNSNLREKIVNQYGGGYGGEDFIAKELGVGHADWSFIEEDMPVNMRYKTAFIVGLNCRYTADKKNAIVFNVNAAKLNVVGNFTIYTRGSGSSSQINTNLKTFAITGTEQRLQLQMGYQRILGENETFNFFVEGGLNVSIVKFKDNLIQINNLVISLYDDNTQAGVPVSSYPANKTTGVGFGAFAGLGINVTTLSKWTLQLVYNPLFENINIGYNPRLKLQHVAGLRMYFML